jgi:hypothetical protein
MSEWDDYIWNEEPMAMLENEFTVFWNRICDSMWEDDSEDIDDVTVTGAPFCGCSVCSARETFAFLMPRFIDLWESGDIKLATTQEPNKEGAVNVDE